MNEHIIRRSRLVFLKPSVNQNPRLYSAIILGKEDLNGRKAAPTNVRVMEATELNL